MGNSGEIESDTKAIYTDQAQHLVGNGAGTHLGSICSTLKICRNHEKKVTRVARWTCHDPMGALQSYE